MTNTDTGTAGLIWGLVWRASLYGMLLCAASGGLYGAAFGTLVFPLLGTALGLFFGTITGALVGLPLGLLDGFLLFGFTEWYRDVGSPDARRFPVQAGIVCTTGSFLALMADWASHGLLEPDSFATGRALLLVHDLLFPSTGSGDDSTPIDALILILWVLVPLLMILCASWLNGVFVARWYAGRVDPAHPPSHGA